MNTRSRSLVLILILTVLFSACSINPATPTETALSASATATRTPLTEYLQTATATEPPPSITPSTIVTMIPATATSTSTPEPPTPTPGPTIAPDLVEDFLIDLYQTNAGCQLPCWWGFTPGESSWLDVKAFYERFGETLTFYDTVQSKEIYYSKHTFGDTGVRISEYFVVEGNDINSVSLGGTTVRSNQIIPGDSYYSYILSDYQLSAILSTYGVPEQVWARTFPGAPEGGDIPFYLVLEYSQLGIAIKYRGNVIQSNSTFDICPQRVDVKLLLWPPEESISTVVDYLEVVSNPGFIDYKPIQEAFNMSIQEFYDTFKTPGNQNCIPTDPDDWDMY